MLAHEAGGSILVPNSNHIWSGAKVGFQPVTAFNFAAKAVTPRTRSIAGNAAHLPAVKGGENNSRLAT